MDSSSRLPTPARSKGSAPSVSSYSTQGDYRTPLRDPGSLQSSPAMVSSGLPFDGSARQTFGSGVRQPCTLATPISSADSSILEGQTIRPPEFVAHGDVIDDRDPIIVYSGAWTAGGTRFESNFTAMITSEKGATATIEFVGRNISVFATIPVLQSGQGRTTATFTLDDGASLPVTTFIADHHPNTTQYYIPMFRSPQLVEDRSHKLVMTHMSDNGGEITFDYMSVQGTLMRYAVPEHGMSSTAKMAVIGGVLGGVVLVLLGLVTALLLKQRRMMKQRTPVYDHTGHSDTKSMNPSGFIPYQDRQQSPMNTGSFGGTGSEIHTRGLPSPATMHRQGSVPTLYRPPLPEIEA